MEIPIHSLTFEYLLYSITKKKKKRQKDRLILFINIKFYKHFYKHKKNRIKNCFNSKQKMRILFIFLIFVRILEFFSLERILGNKRILFV